MWKNTTERWRPQMTIWCMHTWGCKHTQYIIRIAFLQECAPMLRYTYIACLVLLQIKLFLSLTRNTELLLSAPFSMLTRMQIKILLEIFRLSLCMLMTKACTRNARFMPGMRFSKWCGCGFKRRGCDAVSFSERFGTPRRNVMPSSSESSGPERRNTQPTTWHHIPQHTR